MYIPRYWLVKKSCEYRMKYKNALSDLSMLTKDNAHIFQVQTGFKKALFLIITTSRFLSFQMSNVYEIGSLWFHPNTMIFIFCLKICIKIDSK